MGIVTGGASGNIQPGTHDGDQGHCGAVVLAATNAAARNTESSTTAVMDGFLCVESTLQSTIS